MTLTLLCHAIKQPALHVVQAIHDQGWTVRQGRVLAGHLAHCDAWRREIVLPGDFADRLQCPDLAREVEAWALAHELAHIILHIPLILAGQQTEKMELAAADWALRFLVPEGQLRDHPDIRGIHAGHQYRRMARAAEYFHVPVACIASACDRYGILSQAGQWTARDLIAA